MLKVRTVELLSHFYYISCIKFSDCIFLVVVIFSSIFFFSWYEFRQDRLFQLWWSYRYNTSLPNVHLLSSNVCFLFSLKQYRTWFIKLKNIYHNHLFYFYFKLTNQINNISLLQSKMQRKIVIGIRSSRSNCGKWYVVIMSR